MDAKDLLSRGVQAARDGERQRAREFIGRAVQMDPELVQGWWALAHLLEDEKQQIYCLKQVLRIEPAHTKARAKLAAVTAKPEPAPGPAQSAPRIESERGSAARQASRPESAPALSEEQSEAAAKRSSTPKGVWIGVIAALGVFLVGVAFTFLIVAGVLRNPFAGPATDLSSVVLPTMPPAWTPTPTRTQPAATGTAAVVQQDTPVPLERQVLSEDVQAALDLMHGGSLEAALERWDELIERDPEDHFSLAMRARTRLRLASNQSILPLYTNLTMGALADADKAIELHPNLDGDYYMARAFAFENLSRVAENRVDQDRFIELSLENMAIGIALPHTDPTEYYSPPLLMLRLGHCDEVLEEVNRLVDARGDDAAPVPVLHYDLANAYFCKRQYGPALEHIDIALDVLPSCNYRFIRALILYHSGDSLGALEEINRTIRDCPSFSGTRYYMRALIYYEQGAYGQAAEDLLLGSFNTWSQGGLKAYVEALLARRSGDRTQAVASMLYAERTMDRSFGPFVERIRADLAALGSTPEAVTPEPEPGSTPIPTLPAGHPTPPPESFVKYTNGTGEMRLEPGEVRYLHFHAPIGFQYERVLSLKAYFLGGIEGLPTDIVLLAHNPAMDYWHPLELVWGPNTIWSAADYVNTSGDINFRLRNAGNEPVEIENFGITISVEDSQGTNVRYSYQDEG